MFMAEDDVYRCLLKTKIVSYLNLTKWESH